jgi:hypothetical protein
MGLSVVIGILSYPLIKRVMQIALDIFREIIIFYGNRISDLKDTTLYIQLHSLTCDECADIHRDHI